MNEPHPSPARSPHHAPSDGSEGLRLALRFANAEGRLVAAPFAQDGVRVARMVLGLPGLSFPCNVRGGVEAFRDRPSRLDTLTLHLDEQAIATLLRHGDLSSRGLGPVTAVLQDGFAVLQGTIAAEPGAEATPFTLRVALLPDTTLHPYAAMSSLAVFYDMRLYGPASFVATELPERLRQALSELTPTAPLECLGASAWRLRGDRLAAEQLLPHHGFRVPQQGSGHCRTTITPSALHLDVQPKAATAAARAEMEQAAHVQGQAAFRAHSFFAPAELALSQGAHAASARRFYEVGFAKGGLGAAFEEPDKLRWAKTRCFALALHDPALFASALPWDDIDSAGNAPLRLLAAARLSQLQQHAEAAALYDAIADAEPLALDRALALLASARERRATADPQQWPRAVACLREASDRATLPPYAHAWLCEMLMGLEDLPGALEAARTWLAMLEAQDELDLAALAQASCTAAKLCMDCGNGTEEALGHLEQLLARVPNHGPALWQLLRVQGAACHIEAAEQTLDALMQQAAHLEDDAAATALTNLGDAALDALGDRRRAVALYAQALSRSPCHPKAHLRLGEDAQLHHDADAMVQHLQALLTALEDASPTQPVGLSDKELCHAHLLLGSHFMAHGPQGTSPRDLSRGLKHLRHALDLDGERDDVRLRLEDALRAAQDWSALAELLVSTAAQAAARGDVPRARRWQLQAARLHLGERNEPEKALQPLMALVRHSPGDEEALALLVPLLEAKNDVLTLRHVLEDASAEQCLGPLRQGYWLSALWRLERQQMSDASVQLPIIAKLLQIFEQNLEAAQAQVQLLEGQTHLPQEALHAHDRALARAYITLANAAVDKRSRALAWRQAARTLAFVGLPQEALEALEASRAEAPLDVDNWLLGAQLHHDVKGVAAARAWLGQALHGEGEANVALQSFAYRLHDRMAELAAFEHDTLGEIEALHQTLRCGGTSYAVCVRLLAALGKAQRHKERADWLMAWAQAGWPLEVAPSLTRAAHLYEQHGAPEEAKAAYRALAQQGADGMQEAGVAIEAMGRSNDTLKDVLEGLALQHRAAERRRDKDAVLRLSEARVLAYESAGDIAQAVALCQGLLAEDPRARLPHSCLAQAQAKERSWSTALDHGLQATLWGQGSSLSPERDLACWSLTIGLALDLRPELHDELRQHCPHPGLSVPYSERLAARGDVATAEHLLLHMLEIEQDNFYRNAVRLRLAQLYIGPLGIIDQALALLRQNLAADLTDVASRQALLPVYRARGEISQEAELHLALSNLLPDLQEGLKHTLASAELYAQDPQERGTAEQIVMAFARRSDVPKVCPPLWDGLRRMGMVLELRDILVAGLQEQPSADDGRLAVLVRLCAHDLSDVPTALGWCQRMQQSFPAADAPWHLHIELLLSAEGRASPETMLEVEGLYHAWAQLRQGEAQASILDALAQHLRGVGEATAALRALEAALDVSDAGPERARERLMVLCDRYLARADFPRAEQTLMRLLQVMPKGCAQDTQLRRLANLCADHLNAPDRALMALRRLSQRTPEDIDNLKTWCVSQEAPEVLAEVPELCALLSCQTLWAMGQKLVAARSLQSGRLVLSGLLHKLAGDTGVAEPTVEAVWALAADVWPEHGASRALCAWRLEWAEVAPAPWPVRLRLLALTTLHGAAADGQDNLLTAADEDRLTEAQGRPFADSVLTAALEADSACLAQAFALATALHLADRRHRIALAWLEVLPKSDPRRSDPLLVCCEAALAAEDAEQALRCAEELEALGDALAETMMLRALAAQRDRGPYLTRLQARVQVTHGEPHPKDLLELAQEQLRGGLGDKAEQTLSRVGLLARDFEWGCTATKVHRFLGQSQAQAEAAALAAHLAPNRELKAHYLRLEASVRWWELGEIETAHELLHKAQALVPLRYQDLDQTLGADDVEAAKRSLHEALVVMPQALAATLWRRLAALLPHGPPRDEALQAALSHGESDAHELGLIVEAARAAGSHEVLHGALMRLAQLALAQDPRRAARLWLEAAYGLSETRAASLWVRAASALFAVGAQDEAVALVHRALAVGPQDVPLATLVWRHLPEPQSARRAAARIIATHNDDIAPSLSSAATPHKEMLAPVTVDDPLALYQAAGEAALADGAQEEAARYAAWVLSHNVDAAGAAMDVACAEAALHLHERALEEAGNMPALIEAWRRGCRMLMPAHPWVVTRRRRAAFLSVAAVPEQEMLLAWQALLEAEPNLFEAQVQHWGVIAKQVKATVALQRIDQDLQPLAFAPHRTALTLAAATLLHRCYPGSDGAITLLGAQLRLAMTAWQKQLKLPPNEAQASERHTVWQQVAVLGDALAERLDAAGSAGDKLAVLAHCARLAPAEEGLPRLAAAGLLAQEAHQDELAYTLLYPVAIAATHPKVTAEQTDRAQAFCCARAQERREPATVVDLLTRRAQRASPKVASSYFAQAATWAEEGQLGQDQILRLLQASYALRPEPEVARRLVQGLMARGDVAALIAAHYIFVGASFEDDDTQELGLALIAALAQSHHRASEREAAMERVWEAIDSRLPTLAAAKGFRLRRARREGDGAQILAALADCLAGALESAQEASEVQMVRQLHAEAGQLAHELGRTEQSWHHFRIAVDGPEPESDHLWQAWQAHVGAPEEAQESVVPEARRYLLDRIQGASHHLQELAKQKTTSRQGRTVCLRLLIAGAVDAGDTARQALLLQQVWALIKDSGTRPDTRLAQQTSEHLEQVLSERGQWPALCKHLREAALRAPAGRERGMLLWREGDVSRLRLLSPRSAKDAYEAALQHLPGPLPLRMAAATMALELGEPEAALQHVALSGEERPTGADTAHLELLLRAMVAADKLAGCEPIVAELVQRHPGNVFALHARAVHCSRAVSATAPSDAQDAAVQGLGDAESAWAALAAALGGKSAEPAGNMLKRGDALEQAAHYAMGQQTPESYDRACQSLRAAIQCDAHKTVRAKRMDKLTTACRAAGFSDEAALLCEARAEAAEDDAVALSCWLQASEVWLENCRNEPASLRALWQASAVAPQRADIWLAIMDRLPADAAKDQRLKVADQLLLLRPKQLQDPGRLSALAQAYAEHDANRALGLFAQAEAQGGVAFAARADWEHVAWRCDDIDTFVPLAKAFEAAANAGPKTKGQNPEATHDQLVRRARLAEALLLRGKGSREEGLRFLRGAMALLPHPSTAQDVPAMRQVASICATEPQYADIALKLYAIVLTHTPLDVEALRIAARLAGQSQAVDRAYGLYACLLWLFPFDEEARAFVEACRARGDGAPSAAKGGPWVKRVQQALDELIAQGAEVSTLKGAKTFDVAQLLRRDIEVVLSDMLPLPPAQAARGRALSGSPEAMALFRLAQSSHYVQLRQRLGANLARAQD